MMVIFLESQPTGKKVDLIGTTLVLDERWENSSRTRFF